MDTGNILRNEKALHFFLIGTVTALLSVLSFWVLLVGWEFYWGLLAPGFWVGLALAGYSFFIEKRRHDLVNIAGHVVFVLLCSFLFIVAGNVGMPLMILMPVFLVLGLTGGVGFLSGAAGAAFLYVLYGIFIIKNRKLLTWKNLSSFVLIGGVLGAFATGFIFESFTGFPEFSEKFLPWFAFLALWQAPLLAYLGYIDNRPEDDVDGEMEQNSKTAKEQGERTI